jgi:hypothetical protein
MGEEQEILRAFILSFHTPSGALIFVGTMVSHVPRLTLLNGQFPHLSLNQAQGRTPMNIQFDPISWMCPITEVVSLF